MVALGQTMVRLFCIQKKGEVAKYSRIQPKTANEQLKRQEMKAREPKRESRQETHQDAAILAYHRRSRSIGTEGTV